MGERGRKGKGKRLEKVRKKGKIMRRARKRREKFLFRGESATVRQLKTT